MVTVERSFLTVKSPVMTVNDRLRVVVLSAAYVEDS